MAVPDHAVEPDEVTGATETGREPRTEVDADPELDGTDDDGDPLPAPWVQFSEKTFNLDCTEDELARLESLLDDFPEFRIDRLESPEEAEGTNVRVTARSGSSSTDTSPSMRPRSSSKRSMTCRL